MKEVNSLFYPILLVTGIEIILFSLAEKKTNSSPFFKEIKERER